MEACAQMGLDRDTYSVTIPLGATINMNGAAVTITVMTLAAANTLQIPVDAPSALILSLLAALAACGASGVAGGSLLLIPMSCSLFGISSDIAMQVVGVGFIIGVVQDSIETALNSSSDLLLTASAEFRQWRKEGKRIRFNFRKSGENSRMRENRQSIRRKRMRQCMDSENLHRRLKKIIGQVQAIDRMIDEDIPCETSSRRSTAAKSALHRAGQVVLEGHIPTASATASNTATPTRPSKALPKPSSGLPT